MKRFLLTVAFCTCLLAVLSFLLFPVTRAADNPILSLLHLPSPPPPHPEIPFRAHRRADDFLNKSNPPPDDAPIEDLIEYWGAHGGEYNEIGYKVYPSDKVLGRLMAEIEKSPAKIFSFLNILPGDKRSADFVKGIYDGFASGDESEREYRSGLKRWLKFNSTYFSNELARDAGRVSDTDNGYVTNHRELVAVARVDWDRAEPIVNRIYNNPGKKASRTAALWALYVHAIDSGSLSDTDRYRDELKATVEDKSLSAGIRDLALDALSLEKEWSGRDAWYESLLEDETMLMLGTYTGLTTLITAAPEDKYTDRMIALLDSDNINVRSAAARNLLLKLNTKRPEIIKALLPLLTNPKWIKPEVGGREALVQALSGIKLPEAVPALIEALDEKAPATGPRISLRSNTNAAVADRMEDIGRAINANIAANSAGYVYSGEGYPLRSSAIAALSYQADGRAVPALRRILHETAEPYQRAGLIAAIYSCGGFSIAEQVTAVEDVAKNADPDFYTATSNSARTAANMALYDGPATSTYGAATQPPGDVKRILGMYLAQVEVVSDELARAVIDRIGSLDKSDAATGAAMRRIVMRWEGAAVNSLLLRDLKKGRTEVDALLRLLSLRRELRERQMSDVSDLRTGGPIAIGISACLLEDSNDYEAILNSANDETKTTLLACARMIRAPLSVPKVAANLQSKDKLLALAAERYLESEDSPEARRIVLSLHPNEAMILGATTAFYASKGQGTNASPFLAALFATLSPYHTSAQNHFVTDHQHQLIAGTELRLQEELKKDAGLIGVYSWEQNFIRIYKDRALLSWEQDPARYRERVLTKDEFESFKALLTHYKADEQPPYLSCFSDDGCATGELLMLGKNGGRRVFVRLSSTVPPLFAELTRKFEEMRLPPSTVKYWAVKDVPGLEVLFADDKLDAMAVWKNGDDFRLLTADKGRRAEIDAEVETLGEDAVEGSEDSSPISETTVEEAVYKEKTRRAYESFVWSNFTGGTLGTPTAQPTDVGYIPERDDLAVQPSEERWKARSGSVEIRADGTGLHKIVAGRMTKIRAGRFAEPVITPNARWVVATKFNEEGPSQLVRVDLLTNKEFVVDPRGLSAYRAIAYVSSINRVMVGPHEYEYDHDEERGAGEDPAANYTLLDPETGNLIQARGEVRPLAQQTFRALQPATKAFEYWAAIPKENETVVGIYDTRILSFKPILKLSKISFDSMDIWVDNTAARLYFIYEGHLLAAPISNPR